MNDWHLIVYLNSKNIEVKVFRCVAFRKFIAPTIELLIKMEDNINTPPKINQIPCSHLKVIIRHRVLGPWNRMALKFVINLTTLAMKSNVSLIPFWLGDGRPSSDTRQIRVIANPYQRIKLFIQWHKTGRLTHKLISSWWKFFPVFWCQMGMVSFTRKHENYSHAPKKLILIYYSITEQSLYTLTLIIQ